MATPGAGMGSAVLLLALSLTAGCRSSGAEGAGPERPGHPPAGLRALDPRADPSFSCARSRAGTFTIAWRPLGGAVPKNRYFELEVFLYEGELPLPGAEVIVTGLMPEHGHGLVVQPRTLDEGGGRYRVEGMLFHMRGRWELFFDVVKDSYSERTQFDLEVR